MVPMPMPMTFKIEGMTCDHCVRAVTRAVAKVPGVSGAVEVSLARGEARVEGAADPDAVAKAIRDEGYAATRVPA